MKKRILFVSILVISILCMALGITACVVSPSDPYVFDGDTITRLTNYGKGLTEINVPDGVKGIGDMAFYNSSQLQTVFIPSSVTSIGTRVFGRCNELISITVDKENPKYVSQDNCIIEKDTGKLIVGCNNSVIPDFVTSIDDYAFSACIKIKEISIPEGVVSIGNNAFEYCDALESVSMPEKLTSIGNSAFYYCEKLKSLEIPNYVTDIGQKAFAYCKSLEEIYLSSEVTRIEEDTFANCYNLMSVWIPDGLTSIDKYAFSNCHCLTSLYIPSSVTDIASNSFMNCSSLVIKFEATAVSEEWKSFIYGGLSNKYTVPIVLDYKNNEVAVDGYIYTVDESGFQYAVKDGNAKVTGHSYISGNLTVADSIVYDNQTYQVTEIDSYSFYALNYIDDLIIPEGVTTIGDRAFLSCSVASLDLPMSLILIGEQAFYGCSDMTSISLPSSLISIGKGAFNGCSALEVIKVEDNGLRNYTSEGNCLIEKATNTLVLGCKNSEIPDYVEIIGDNAFYGCRALKNITLPSGLTKIGDGAFSACVRLTSIVIPDSVTKMGAGVFQYCSQDLKIRCEVNEQPRSWDIDWNRLWVSERFAVEWGYEIK